jgi:hypothetical protein
MARLFVVAMVGLVGAIVGGAALSQLGSAQERVAPGQLGPKTVTCDTVVAQTVRLVDAKGATRAVLSANALGCTLQMGTGKGDTRVLLFVNEVGGAGLWLNDFVGLPEDEVKHKPAEVVRYQRSRGEFQGRITARWPGRVTGRAETRRTPYPALDLSKYKRLTEGKADAALNAAFRDIHDALNDVYKRVNELSKHH